MTVAQHIVQRVSQLRTEQAHWEGVRQQASAKLLERANRELDAEPEAGSFTDNEQEQLRSQISAALFHFQEIGQKLTQLHDVIEAEAREASAHDPEVERQAMLQRDDARNEQLAKEAAEKAEAWRKEEQQKAAVLEKEQRDKEFFEKKESDRLEALAADERPRQEALAKDEQEKQDALAKAEQDKGAQQSDLEFLATINAEWEFIQAEIAAEWAYVDQEIAKEWAYVVEEIGKEWEYVGQEIQKEMEYNVAQTLDAVSEAAFEVGRAIANPVSQEEGKEFLKAQGQALADFVSDEVFQGAPAEHKEMWLKHKLQEQLRAESDTFGDRNDDSNIRKLVQQGLGELHGKLLEAVKEERKIETRVNDEVEARDAVRDATLARLEKSSLSPEALEEKKSQLDAVAKKHEQELRDSAEQQRRELWAAKEAELRAIEDEKGKQFERQEAEKRREAERERQEHFQSF